MPRPSLSWLCRISLIVVGLLLTGAGLALAARPAPASLTLAEYWQRVEETRALAEGLTQRPGAEQKTALAAAADQWAASTTVTTPAGDRLEINTRPLVELLRADPPNPAQVQNYLSQAQALQRVWPAPRHTATDLTALQNILARPEYRWKTAVENPLARWWRELQERLLRELIKWLPAGTAPFLPYLLGGLAVIGVVAVLAYLLRGLWGEFVAEAHVPEAEAGLDEHLTATTALQRAQTFAEAGDYRAAVRYLYLSTLLLLEERGVLRYNRSLTNREYLRSVAQQPHLAAILGEVVDIFDRVWYGYQPLDATAYQRYAERVTELQEQR